MATPQESMLLTKGWGDPTGGECDNCSELGEVWEIGGGCYCSAECALQSIPEVGYVSFEEYLWDLRLKANLLDIYDALSHPDE